MKEAVVQVCCMSAGRPQNVIKVQEQFPNCIWYVPGDQVAAYKGYGASEVVGVKSNTFPMKWLQLNQALDDWPNEIDAIATVDDDIEKCLDVCSGKSISPQIVVQAIAEELLNSSFKLGGAFNGSNTKWAGGIIRNAGCISGAMMVHLPSALRFSPIQEIGHLEDHDYCLQHHVTYGGVVIHGGYCMKNKRRGNPGGYQSRRDREMDLDMITKMTNKWGSYGYEIWEDLSDPQGYKTKIPWKKIALSNKGV